MQDILTIFFSVFLAELGDKTQLATLLFSSEGKVSPFWVFVASASALVVTSAIAAAAGCLIHRYLANIPLKMIAGCCFVLIGLWTIGQAWYGK